MFSFDLDEPEYLLLVLNQQSVNLINVFHLFSLRLFMICNQNPIKPSLDKILNNKRYEKKRTCLLLLLVINDIPGLGIKNQFFWC